VGRIGTVEISPSWPSYSNEDESEATYREMPAHSADSPLSAVFQSDARHYERAEPQ